MQLQDQLLHPRRDGSGHEALLQQVGWLGGRPCAALIDVPWKLREVSELREPEAALLNQLDVNS
jgi:hypothetical protein